jgi:hypothetical protein
MPSGVAADLPNGIIVGYDGNFDIVEMETPPQIVVPCTSVGRERKPVLSGPQGSSRLATSPSSRLLLFVQFPTFVRGWQRLRLGDAGLQALERELIDSPDKAPVIEQTGGLRKLRFTPPGSGRGKSGAFRVCYS